MSGRAAQWLLICPANLPRACTVRRTSCQPRRLVSIILELPSTSTLSFAFLVLINHTRTHISIDLWISSKHQHTASTLATARMVQLVQLVVECTARTQKALFIIRDPPYLRWQSILYSNDADASAFSHILRFTNSTALAFCKPSGGFVRARIAVASKI
jgi:hypothetical protein